MTHARRQGADSGLAVAHIFQKGPSCRTNCSPSILLACALFAFPAFAQTGAAPEPPLHPAAQRRCADARSGEAGARDAPGRQEARADDRYAARDRQSLAAGTAPPQARRTARARTAIRDSAHGGQPWRAASADGVRAGRRDLARDRGCGADADAFPAFYYWIVRTANDPSAYGQLLDIAWKLALVFGCAFAAEWLIFRLIKRPVALLEARLPRTARCSGADAGDSRSALLRG